MIEIKNLKFHQYTICTNILENENTGIYCPHEDVVKQLLLILSGINYSNECFYKNKILFDDEKYFQERIYMDCEKKYVHTLLDNIIQNLIATKYHKVFHQDLFKKYVKELLIRCEGKFDIEYNFNNNGNQLVNLALALAIYAFRILYHPFSYIQDTKKIEYLKNEIKEKRGNLIGIDSLKKYTGIFDKLIILANNQVIEIKEPNTKFLVIFEIDEETISDLNLESILLYRSIHNINNIIIQDLLTKEQKKKLNHNKERIKEISLYDLEDYI